MTRALNLVGFLLLISIQTLGQCLNSPTVSLSSTSGNRCGLTAVTVAANTFGGSATKVTITENGSGSVSPTSSTKSPFTFTYTPKNGDYGKTVIITVTTNNPLGLPCAAATATYTLTVNTNPSAPAVGTITRPTCAVPTGSVALSGLPASGIWTLTRSPGGITSSGTGTSFTISDIPSGTYTFTVTSQAGCTSSASSNVVIPAQPASPTSPLQTVDCTLGPGRAVVKVSSPTGNGITYSLDGGSYQSSTSFSNINEGNHSLTVKNSSGCTTTGAIFQVTCGCINPPTVTLSSISGNTCANLPVTVSGNSFGGSATSVTITENGAGTVSPLSSTVSPFAFTYTPEVADAGNTIIINVTSNNISAGPCTPVTAIYTLTVIPNLSAPLIGSITQPTCTVATGSVILNGLPPVGTWTLTRTPGGVTTTGTGTSTLVSGLSGGSYTFTVSSAGCISGSSSSVVITAQSNAPSAPTLLNVTQPTCYISTGSALLNGLPSNGNWTLIRYPGAINTTGSGTTILIPDMSPATYTFTVTNSSGCLSPPSNDIVINVQPTIPTPPVIGTITSPTCIMPTGSVQMTGLPSSGTWTLTRYPGAVTSTGTGTGITVSGIPPGLYNYTLTNAGGCVSLVSANVSIPASPANPPPPSIGTISQPHNDILTGSVILGGLPETGFWSLTRSPDNVISSGTGNSITISGIPPGTYQFSVTNSIGCNSGLSENLVINSLPGSPLVVITNPAPVCFPQTVDITDPKITTGSTSNLIYTYWTDAAGITQFKNPSAATAGTWYIKGTSTDGLFTIKPVKVTVYHSPLANAGTDKTLVGLFITNMDAELINNYETGAWSVISGTGQFSDSTYAKTSVRGLSSGKNVYLWRVSNGVCPASLDSVEIFVQEYLIPSLITPNMDGRNDYFVIKGFDEIKKIELIIFDRRGVQVFKNVNYDNRWNGIDLKGNPLPDDTYFYVLNRENEKSLSGYIVIRR